VALLDFSSFKCGHDAPTYGIVESIVSGAGSPYAALHDLDANKPGGSIKIRVKTYSHSLKLHEEALDDAARKRRELSESIDKKRLELLRIKQSQLVARRGATDATLDTEIAALADRVRAYTAPPTEERAAPESKGLIQLKRKQSDGSVVALDR
jgi:hypothetical protein